MGGPRYASIWERAAALGIDTAAAGLWFVALATPIAYIEAAVRGGGEAPLRTPPLWTVACVDVVFLGALWKWWQSPGSAAIGVRVVSARTLGRPSLARCLVRSIPVLATGLAGFQLATLILLLGAPHADPGAAYLAELVRAGLLLAVALVAYLPYRFTSQRQSLWDMVTGVAVLDAATSPDTADAPGTFGGPSRE